MSLDPGILGVFCSEVREARLQARQSEYERTFVVSVHNSGRRRQASYEKTNLATGRCCKCSKLRDPESKRYCTHHLTQQRKYSLKWMRANQANRRAMKKELAVEVLLPEKRQGRPKKIFDHRKLEKIRDPEIESPLVAIESLLIFDARCLDLETRQELLRLIPQLTHIRRAWKAEYTECGCTCCHKKKAGYGAGGFCNGCWGRIYQRMRIRFRNAMRGRDLVAETETFKDALQLRYNAAQRLFNSDD
jgi:hypothetical protein